MNSTIYNKEEKGSKIQTKEESAEIINPINTVLGMQTGITCNFMSVRFSKLIAKD